MVLAAAGDTGQPAAFFQPTEDGQTDGVNRRLEALQRAPRDRLVDDPAHPRHQPADSRRHPRVARRHAVRTGPGADPPTPPATELLAFSPVSMSVEQVSNWASLMTMAIRCCGIRFRPRRNEGQRTRCSVYRPKLGGCWKRPSDSRQNWSRSVWHRRVQ